MKKEYLAINLGLALYFVIFIGSVLLDSAGLKQQSRIGVAISMILFGTTAMVGMYSNVKNYGYLWAGVRRGDRNLAFNELDKKYSRAKKGTWQYMIVVGCVSVVGFLTLAFGVACLFKEM